MTSGPPRLSDMPRIGKLTITEIKPSHIHELLEPVSVPQRETANRVRVHERKWPMQTAYEEAARRRPPLIFGSLL